MPQTERPDISLVMPCYNEEESLPYSVPRLLRAFEAASYRLQLVTVNNGSRDRTWEVINQFASEHPEITPVMVETNIGFGNGVISGLPHAVAPWVGTVAADGQVDAEDLVRLYEAAMGTDGRVLAKVRRRFRMDGFLRKIISVGYNGFVWMLWPGIGTLDVNGQPRIMRRERWQVMDLRSTNWLLDPEMIIKAHYMGLRIIELNVFARMRGNGLSHVRFSTCWEFFIHLLKMRFSGELSAWRGRLSATEPLTSKTPASVG
jgi:glycosyltransferase involved in cell wall biosynthesis